jgi:hypothetical protein
VNFSGTFLDEIRWEVKNGVSRCRAGVEFSIVDGALQGVVTSLGRPSTYQNLACTIAAFRDSDRRPWS